MTGEFYIYSGKTLVGYSALEHRDPSMGVAFGDFYPTNDYTSIQRVCSSNHRDQSDLNLKAQTETGIAIPCAGVAILDYSQEVSAECIEVHVLGIPHPIYDELFADRPRIGADQICS